MEGLVNSGEHQDEISFKKELFDRKEEMLVVGHRGGFKPDNTLSAFKQAKDNNLKAVELDVWITLDNQVVVIHGGQDGELPGDSRSYIYDYTLADLREEYSKTDEFKKNQEQFGANVQIPTLKEVFDLFERQVLVNVEIKAPKTEALRPKYDTNRLITNLDKLLQDENLTQLSLISSFDHDLLQKYQEYYQAHDQQTKVDFVYLSTRTIEGTVQPVPEKSVTDSWRYGCNIQPSKATAEIVKRFHDSNQIVGVWIHKEITTDEGPELWKTMKQNGVDMFCTDHPLEVIETLHQA